MSQAGEIYTHGHHESVVSQHAERTAAEAAAFLLPMLKPGMRVLDFGCGPGTITVGLAEAVAPGEVVGIDISDDVISQAREHASSKGVTNVSFTAGNVYDLPYEEASMDAAYAHQVLQHLARPAEALSEIRRLLKPGGFVGVREVDWGATAVSPVDARLERFMEVYHEVSRRNGGNADAGRYVREWLVQAGFSDHRLTTSTWTFADPASTQKWGDSWATRIVKSSLAKKAVEYGIATPADLEEMSAGWREWGRSPTAFFSFIHVEGVGWKR
ncbi:MAG: methyltransferase domain-containing protein [Dehalococcoidia bacterium]